MNILVLERLGVLMKEFKIEIVETLQKTIVVLSDNLENAIDKVREHYYNGEIVLDSNDFIETKFQEIKEN